MGFREDSDTGIRSFDLNFLIKKNDILTILRRFLLIFASHKLNVTHTSTSGLVDLRT